MLACWRAVIQCITPRVLFLTGVFDLTRLPLLPLPLTVTASISLPLLHRLKKLIEPVIEPGSQGFVDLSYLPDGSLAPERDRVWQFALSLVQVDGLGKTGEAGAGSKGGGRGA